MKKLQFLLISLFTFFMFSTAQAENLTLNQFSDRVNSNLKSLEAPLRLPADVDIKSGEVNDVAQYMFTDYLGVTINLEKGTKNVKSIMTALTLPKDKNELLLTLMYHSAVISAYGGKGAMKTVGKRYIQMTSNAITEFGSSTEDTTNKDFVLNGKKYGIMISKTLGGILGFAEPAK